MKMFLNEEKFFDRKLSNFFFFRNFGRQMANFGHIFPLPNTFFAQFYPIFFRFITINHWNLKKYKFSFFRHKCNLLLWICLFDQKKNYFDQNLKKSHQKLNKKPIFFIIQWENYSFGEKNQIFYKMVLGARWAEKRSKMEILIKIDGSKHRKTKNLNKRITICSHDFAKKDIFSSNTISACKKEKYSFFSIILSRKITYQERFQVN